MQLYTDSILTALIGLLSESRLKSLTDWLPTYGGSASGVGSVVRRIISILSIPFTYRGGGVDATLLARIQKLIYNQMCVRHLITGVGKGYVSGVSDIEVVFQFLGTLVLGSTYFVKQFIDYGGLGVIESVDLLKPTLPSSLLVDTLQLLSQLARMQKENYEPIHRSNRYQRFRSLLAHGDAAVRAKCCNLIGNLCRHSNYFYPHFVTYVLPHPPVSLSLSLLR